MLTVINYLVVTCSSSQTTAVQSNTGNVIAAYTSPRAAAETNRPQTPRDEQGRLRIHYPPTTTVVARNICKRHRPARRVPEA